MMLSYIVLEGGGQLLTIALDPAELGLAAATWVDVPLEQLGAEAAHLNALTVRVCGPLGRELTLRAAVEQRDAGADVRYRGRPGLPDE